MMEKVYETIRHAFIARIPFVVRVIHGGIRARGVAIETSERSTLISWRHRGHMWLEMKTAYELGLLPKNHEDLTDEQLNKHLESLKGKQIILKSEIYKSDSEMAKPEPEKSKAR